MGFSCIYSNIIIPTPIVEIIQIICHIRFILVVILSYFGLYAPTDIMAGMYSFNLSSPDDQSSPSTAIKSKLPVVELASFVEAQPGTATCMTCVVCLGWLEAKDEVRELGNCCHAFHKECIDRWIDAGHFTCPMCRSQLLPCQRTVIESARWMRV